MGFFGGFISFVITLFVCGLLTILFLPAIPALIPPLTLLFCSCVIGIYLPMLMAPIMGAAISFNVAFSRILGLALIVVITTLTLFFWTPVLGTQVAAIAAGIGAPITSLVVAVFGLILLLIVQLILTGITYSIAAVVYSRSPGPSVAEAQARGACAGVSMAFNLFLFFGVVVPYVSLATGPASSLILVILLTMIAYASLIPFLRNSVTGRVSNVNRTIIGWMTGLVPSAWLLEFIGVILFLLNLFFHGTLGWFFPAATITGMGTTARTGSVVVFGGLVANLNPAPIYNMGTFTFTRSISPSLIPLFYNDADFIGYAVSVRNHEIGHQLNLAAFGTAFNIVGFVDQWLRSFSSSSRRMYGEDLASTNDDTPTPIFTTPLRMWVI